MHTKPLLGAVLCGILLLGIGCTPIQPASGGVDGAAADSATASQEPASGAASEAPATGAEIVATDTVTSPVALTATVLATADVEAMVEGDADTELAASEVATGTETTTSATAMTGSLVLTTRIVNGPVALEFPALNLTVPVSPMRWEVVRDGDVRTTRWVLPADAAGWHPDSAGAGEAGNTIVSGSQLAGAAVFAPIALGDVVAGQEIVVTTSEGERFSYTVTEVSEPLALEGDAAATAALLAYLQPALPSGAARLTLLTGWPDFTTTHRIVVVAEQSGSLP
jgi:hypothetical protein